MLDRATFTRFVAEAFSHLDDRPYLLAHPLASILGGPGGAGSAEATRQALLDAVEQLRPPRGSPASSTRWRRWNTLVLRYVEGLSPKQIAQKLQVSERQTRRDHEAGVEAAAAVLWERRRPPATGGEPVAVPSVRPMRDETGPPEVELAARAELSAELARLTTTSQLGSAHLADAVESAISTLRNLAATQRAEFDVALSHDLDLVAIDPAVLRQILLCLLSAALQEMRPGNRTGRIGLAATRGDSTVQMCVRVDRGRGRAVEAGDRDAAALIEAACQLIRQSGGSLDIVETADHLRSIRAVLPAAPTIRVLVVDDNPDVVQLFRRFLAGQNYHLVQARTPPTALELAREIRPDVITLDVMMPSQDGWQLLQHFREDPVVCDVPVIVCSILPERPLALSLGANDFLPKPVSRQSLRSALERCREARRGGNQAPGAGTSSARPR